MITADARNQVLIVRVLLVLRSYGYILGSIFYHCCCAMLFGMLANIMIAVSPLVWLKREIWEAKSNLIHSKTLTLYFFNSIFVLALFLRV